jgi:hypothetical protein
MICGRLTGCARRERQCNRRTAEKGGEIAPF